MWRGGLLLLLNPRPPWWGRSGVWAALGAALILLYLVARMGTDEFQGATVYWWQDGAGAWHWGQCEIGYQREVALGANIHIDRQWGRESWRVKPWSSQQPPGAALPPQAVLDQLRRDGWQRFIDEGRARGDSRRPLIPAFEMLRDGVARRTVTRPSYWVIGGAGAAGVLVALLGLAAWFLRASLMVGYRHKLELAAAARCPGCGYLLRGLGERAVRCPECGLDVLGDVLEAQRELGKG